MTYHAPMPPDRPQYDRLAELLGEPKKIDAAIKAVPTIHVHGVPRA